MVEKPEGFEILVFAVAAAFRVEADQALLEGLWLGLEDLPWTRVRSALESAPKRFERMPTVAELREAAREPELARHSFTMDPDDEQAGPGPEAGSVDSRGNVRFYPVRGPAKHKATRDPADTYMACPNCQGFGFEFWRKPNGLPGDLDYEFCRTCQICRPDRLKKLKDRKAS